MTSPTDGLPAADGLQWPAGMCAWTPSGQVVDTEGHGVGAQLPVPDQRRAGAILDRDGTLTVYGHHLTDQSDLVALPGAQQAVAEIAATHRVVVATNQSIVGRGKATPARMAQLHRRLHELFPQVELVLHCPHVPDDECGCRKPATGMLDVAVEHLRLDRAATAFVGDSWSDVGAAVAAGVRPMLVRTGLGADHADRAAAAGHAVVADLPAALRLMRDGPPLRAAQSGATTEPADEHPRSTRTQCSRHTPSNVTATSETGTAMADMHELFSHHADQLRAALDGLADATDVIEGAAAAIAGALRAGGKVLAAGNGGSAAEAQHLTAEVLGRLGPDRQREPLPAIALHADTSTLTAAANDYGYDDVFARQVRGLGRAEDVFIGLSTSGNSANVVRAARDAAEIGMATVALVGAAGGDLAKVCDHVIAVPSEAIGAIQECHLVLVHVLVERTEDILYGPEWASTT